MRSIFENRILFFPVSIFISLIVSLVVFHFTSLAGYNSYWTAIDRVRNIDVNIISSSFPLSASIAISRGRYDVLNAMVDSNGSNFGIAIEKCVDEFCLDFKRLASNRSVDRDSFSLIEIPVFHEKYLGEVKVFFERSFSDEPTYIDYDRTKMIGRILVNKPNPPGFKNDIYRFIQRFIQGRDFAARYITYRNSIWLSLSIFLLNFLLIFILRMYYLNLIARRRIAENMKKRLEKIRSIGI